MKKRLLGVLSSVALSSLCLFSCESATATVGEGKVDTLYINDGDKILWGLRMESNDSSINKSHIRLMSSGVYEDIPHVTFNNTVAQFDNEMWDLVDELQFFTDTIASGETITFQTIYQDDTLNGSVVVPPRITNLSCNGVAVLDTAKNKYYGNVINSTKDIPELRFTWENPPGYNAIRINGNLSFTKMNGNYGYVEFNDSVVTGNSLDLNLSSLGAIAFTRCELAFYISDSDKLKMGGKPDFSSKKQKMYTQLYGPSWDVDVDFE